MTLIAGCVPASCVSSLAGIALDLNPVKVYEPSCLLLQAGGTLAPTSLVRAVNSFSAWVTILSTCGPWNPRPPHRSPLRAVPT